ncbi:MAG: DNA polymerase III subunit delta [Fimbriimonadaceae bacterium]|nr:DNA polymerase III subunit delta [Fimbriimonadaceae bacterium]
MRGAPPDRAAQQVTWRGARELVRSALEALERGAGQAVYLLAGADDLQRQVTLQGILDRLLPVARRDTGLTVFDGRQTTAGTVAAALESAGFLFDDEPRRVVLVRQAPWFVAGCSDNAEPLRARLAAGLLDDLTLLLEVPSAIDRRLGLSKQVLTSGVVLEFPALKNEAEVRTFVEEHLAAAGKRLPSEAFGELFSRVGPDAMALSSELDKLICYVDDDDTITLRDVRAMVAPTAELSVFELVDAVAEGQTRAALGQLAGLLGQHAEPLMVARMLQRQFRLLLQARWLLDQDLLPARAIDGNAYDFNRVLLTPSGGSTLLDRWKTAAAEVLPLEGKVSLLTQHYYPLWKTLRVARQLTSAQLEAALERLLQTDLAIKTSHLEPAAELELLVVDLCTRISSGATAEWATWLES